MLGRCNDIYTSDIYTIYSRVSQNEPKCEFSKTFLGIAVLHPKNKYKNKLGLSFAKLRTSLAELGLAVFQLTG